MPFIAVTVRVLFCSVCLNRVQYKCVLMNPCLLMHSFDSQPVSESVQDFGQRSFHIRYINMRQVLCHLKANAENSAVAFPFNLNTWLRYSFIIF